MKIDLDFLSEQMERKILKKLVEILISTFKSI
jgi:hypothetical protein